jgi:hypothetical protein
LAVAVVVDAVATDFRIRVTADRGARYPAIAIAYSQSFDLTCADADKTHLT